MNRYAAYLLLSIVLHLGAGWLLHGLKAAPADAHAAVQTPMAIALVDLAPAQPQRVASAAPVTPAAAARPVPVPAKQPAPDTAKPVAPKPLPAKPQPAVAATTPSPKPVPRPAEPQGAPARPAQASSQPAQPAPTQPTAATAPAAAATPIISLRPRFASPPPPPRYPSTARRRNLQGIVRVEVSLDERGQQLKLAITRSSGVESLDQAALEAVAQWRFLPESVDGRAVPSRVEIPIEFALTASR